MTQPGEAPRRITPFTGVPAVMPPRGFPLDYRAVSRLVNDALAEDRAFEDITTIPTVVSDRRARGRLVARANGVLAGVPLATAAFCVMDDKMVIRVDNEDGSRVSAGETVLYLAGHARALLSAERVALNFLQRLSGIASLTRKFVDAIAGTRATILDTRKTLPGWRTLEKYAVRCGGGSNHRMDLASAVLIKDNHLFALEGDIGLAVRRCREHAPAGTTVQVECDRPEQVQKAIAAGADAVLFDNMSVDRIRESVLIARGKAVTEVSGGVTLSNVREIAETGVDRISIGSLTHSAPALDLALDFE
ncbi:MAG TPA: carboxylating nicotinate-nucleotide diphosphorylase [Gemmatimonadaceae bacterium]|nr:carboxylating nicotinate-nucleotide diphosphorylase [Gemmatimonadaceae bacterium]